MPYKGCEAGSAVEIFTVHRNPGLTIAATPTAFCGNGTVTLTSAIIALDPDIKDNSLITYQWALNGTVLPGASLSSLNYTLDKPGIYRFTACLSENINMGWRSDWATPVTVRVDALPETSLYSNKDTYCAGGEALLTAAVAPAGNYTYHWYLDQVLVASTTGKTLVSRGLAPRGTAYAYHVVAVSPGGCESRSNDIKITVKAPPAVIAILDHTDIGIGGAVTATANVTPAGNNHYVWYVDGIAYGYERQLTIRNRGLGAHSVYVDVMPADDKDACGSSSNTVYFTVHPNPGLTLKANASLFCGTGEVTLNATVIGLNPAIGESNLLVYQWALNGVIIPGANLNVLNYKLTAPGIYRFTARLVENINLGWISDWATTITVTVEAAPTVSLVSDNDAYCTGGSAKLTAIVSPSGNYTYEWYLDNVRVASGNTNTFISNGLTPRTTPYTYHVVVHAAIGCNSKSNDQPITVKTLPKVSIASDFSDICAGGGFTATANVTPTGDYNYVWYLDGKPCGYDRQLTLYNLKAGAHEVYAVVTPAVDYLDCVAISNTIPFTVIPNPELTLTADNTTFCGSGRVTLTTSLVFGGTAEADSRLVYQWALNGAVIPGALQSTYSQMLTGGVYEFTARVVQNDNQSCVSDWAKPVVVTVKDIAVPEFFTTSCDDEAGNLYRTVNIPITARNTIPQAYTVTYTDATRSSLNISEMVRNNNSTPYITVRLPLDAGDYELIIDIDGCQFRTTGRVLVDAYAMKGAKLLEQRWDDVLVVNNNPLNNGGFIFYEYQWYKNNLLIPGATKQYYTEPDGKLNGSYHVVLQGHAILSSEETVPVTLVTCSFIPEMQLRVAVYPVPVAINQPFTLDTSLSAEELEGATLEIFDATGKMQRKMTVLNRKMSVEGFKIEGLYIGRLQTRNNGVHSFKFIVSK